MTMVWVMWYPDIYVQSRSSYSLTANAAATGNLDQLLRRPLEEPTITTVLFPIGIEIRRGNHGSDNAHVTFLLYR